MPDRHIDDIALFFAKNGKVAKCFIPRTVYADPNQRLDPAMVPSYWSKAALLEEAIQGQDEKFFVTNLSLLEDPGVSPIPKDDDLPPARTDPPGPADLVVIPYDEPDTAYVVPKSTYEDKARCIPIKDEIDPDLIFMALNEGVVLANVPKHDLAGATCNILNLLALRSYPPGS